MVGVIQVRRRLVAVAINAIQIQRGCAHIADRTRVNPCADGALGVRGDVMVDELAEERHTRGGGAIGVGTVQHVIQRLGKGFLNRLVVKGFAIGANPRKLVAGSQAAKSLRQRGGGCVRAFKDESIIA